MSKIKKLYLPFLISVAMNIGNVYASAAADDEQPGAPAASSGFSTYSATASELEIIKAARLLKDAGRHLQALDKLVKKGPSKNPDIIAMIDELQVNVYHHAMNRTGEFYKETEDDYLKEHAAFVVNGYAQCCLNLLALRSSSRYTDATGRQYLEDRFTNHTMT